METRSYTDARMAKKDLEAFPQLYQDYISTIVIRIRASADALDKSDGWDSEKSFRDLETAMAWVDRIDSEFPGSLLKALQIDVRYGVPSASGIDEDTQQALDAVTEGR